MNARIQGDSVDSSPGSIKPVERSLIATDFAPFYRNNIVQLVALASALCPSRAAAEDVAQEAMLVTFRRWEEVSQLDKPEAWTCRVCVNISVSQFRRFKTEIRLLRRLVNRPLQYDQSEISSDTQELWAEVRRLPRRQAQAIALHYVYGLPITEIAGILECSQSSVKTHLTRGRQHLAEALGVVDGDQ